MSDVITIDFETAIYPLEQLKRAAHGFLADFYIDIRSGGPIVTIELRTKSGSVVPGDLVLRLKNSVLDESLRAQVRAETRGVHEALVRAALQEIVPEGGSQ